jgi:hypothetical protein
MPQKEGLTPGTAHALITNLLFSRVSHLADRLLYADDDGLVSDGH